jgi:CHAT domain-containing protein
MLMTNPQRCVRLSICMALALASAWLLPSRSWSMPEADLAPSARTPAADMAGWTATIERTDASPSARIEALIRRGETYRTAGHWGVAETDLSQALEQARLAEIELLEGVAAYALGQLYAQTQRESAAESVLREALAQAERLGHPALTGAIANSLATVLAAEDQRAQARALYAQALSLARESGDSGLAAAVYCNRVQLLLDADRNRRVALRELQAAHRAAVQTTDPEERAQLLLRIGQAGLAAGNIGRAFGADRLRQAASLASSEKLPSIQARALGELGRLHEENGQTTKALALTEQAVLVSPIGAHDLRYPLEWRIGRLYRERGDRSRAIAAYRRAVDHLDRVRPALPVSYESGSSSFRERFGPLYLELADLLIQQAADYPDSEQEQSLLDEAQARVEQIKLDELRDYLRDACLQPLRKQVGSVASGTAVLYPIILPDRLELLLRTGDRMHRFTSPVGAAVLERAAAQLRRALSQRRSAPTAAQSLYDWLIAPIEPELAAHSVTTLAVVPDGALRTIPFAALSNRGEYLIEQFALVTLPGLTLIDPQPLPRFEQPALLAGLSRPGPVVADLPSWWLDALVRQYRGGLQANAASTRRGAAVRDPAGGQRGFSASALPSAPLVEVDAPETIAALSLPGVRAELEAVAGLLPAKTLVDEAFRRERFIDELNRGAHPIVHIASHGVFGGSPEQNFILTYDKRLDMNRFASALRPKELSRTPVELLVLSACQTAEGDDRTPLGLTGVALQSGARGAIGALWPVDDAATQLIMRRLYENLRDPGATKGRALQQAQLALLREPAWTEPYYWAPFILVGNWL